MRSARSYGAVVIVSGATERAAHSAALPPPLASSRCALRRPDDLPRRSPNGEGGRGRAGEGGTGSSIDGAHPPPYPSPARGEGTTCGPVIGRSRRVATRVDYIVGHPP